jgi:hypothetical protein
MLFEYKGQNDSWPPEDDTTVPEGHDQNVLVVFGPGE